MKSTKLLSFIGALLFSILFLVSCRNTDEDGESNADPFVGNWKLRVVTANGQSQDVSNVTCWKDTTLNVTETIAKFYLSVQNTQTGNCQTSQEQYQWSKNNDTYYYTENGQQYTLPIQFLDNNQTLQMSLNSNGTTVIFSFKK